MGLQDLERRIESTEGLHSVVRTMKSLAAVSIQQLLRAAESTREYARTIDLALQIVFRGLTRGGPLRAEIGGDGPVGAIIYGSVRGMCGQFNQQIATFATQKLSELGVGVERRSLMAMGERVIGSLQAAGQPIERRFAISDSLSDASPMLSAVLTTIDDWQRKRGIERVLLFYNRPKTRASCDPVMQSLLPLDLERFRNQRESAWESHSLPTYTMPTQDLLSALLRQYLFVSLYQAFVESLASENGSRLSAMQAAENNVEERLEELNAKYHQERQGAITSELLDIVSGFEALTVKEA